MNSATYAAYWGAAGTILMGCAFVWLCWWVEPGDLWELD